MVQKVHTKVIDMIEITIENNSVGKEYTILVSSESVGYLMNDIDKKQFYIVSSRDVVVESN